MRVFDISGCRAFCLGVVLLASGYAQAFQDPTQVAAAKSKLMLLSPLTAVINAGKRTIAVGQRGHIVVSDDGGQSWQQASVPVSSDLVAVSFAGDRHGWAVGHGGVVLHSADGGLNWELQLEGKQASRLILEYYSDKSRGGALENAQMLLEREKILLSYGGTQPLMAVHFTDEKVGYVVGLFNRILKTVDGGKTWEPWQHRIDNPNELHFYSIGADAHALYITGEQGMVWRLGKGEQGYVARPTGYDGTLFGSVSNGKVLIAYGMRGSVYRSVDLGATWQRVDVGTQAGITAGVYLEGGQFVLGSLAGEIALSSNGAKTFDPVNLKKMMPFFGLASMPGNDLMLVGAAGIQREALVLKAPDGAASSVLVERIGNPHTTYVGAGHGRIN